MLSRNGKLAGASGNESGPSLAETRIIAANVDFYVRVAERYDSYEPYLFDPKLQQSLEDDLDAIASCFASLRRAPSCLECGGGTGNLTLKMCARGWQVTVVDVSDQMLALLKRKGEAQGHSPELIHMPIERFLETCSESYDLVAFSSVLHHLYSYSAVVDRVVRQVRPGGVFYSNYDPLPPRSPFWSRAFNTFDIGIAKLLFDPDDVLPGIARRLRKLTLRRDSMFGRAVAGPGDLAEFHVGTGVNDKEILQLLEKSGFSLVEHRRFATGRTALSQFLNERLRLFESFKIIARRGQPQTEIA